jgi:hypothetical protein
MCAHHAVTAVKSRPVSVHPHRQVAQSIPFTLHKCTLCGRIKHFSDWLHLDEIADAEVRRNLSWFIMTGDVDWKFLHCPDCLMDSYT